MNKIIRIIERTSDIASGHFTGWLIVIMMALVMVEVVSRYIFNQALGVGDEFSAYMLVAISFMGLAYVARRQSHIRITVVVSKLRPNLRNWLRLVTLVIALIFFSLLTKASYDFIAYSISHGMRSGSWLRTPLVGPQIFMFIGAALICLQIFVELIYAIRTLRTPKVVT